MEEGFSLCILILISFQFFLATSGILNSSSSSQGAAVCAVINCGQGTCKASNASFLGFDCECNSGWRKPQIGLFTFPYCVLPNGTSEFRSGGGSLPTPLLPPTTVVPFLHTPFEFSNFSACWVVWCGNGTCVADGAAAYSYTCRCHEGFGNFLNLTFLPCFRRCYFGEDCHCAVSPHRSASASIPQKMGWGNTLKFSWNLPFFVMQTICVSILTWL